MKLSQEELDALKEEVQAGAGDWSAEVTAVDGIPIDEYVVRKEDDKED